MTTTDKFDTSDVPARQLKAERAKVESLVYAREIAESFFGDRVNFFAIKQLSRYSFDDEDGEREFAKNLHRAQEYAKEIFANDRPSPEEVFFAFENVVDDDDEDEDEESEDE